MASFATSQLCETEAKVVHLSTDVDIRPKSSESWQADEYAEMVRVVLEKDIKSLTALGISAGLTSVGTLNNVYFQGAGPYPLSLPTGWSNWKLIRMSIDPIEVDGSAMLRLTQEYVARKASASNNPDWTTFAWT